ncbi:uncharacterized protein DUF2868 [Rhodothalassium salexigens DSM 2132]|uniref:Uncharacterized protein DUF2868 n=1 Tax=Rhodothalassium salexigens DSM 2132 TaxID=1188247 RepID=A0A4R2P917_RHOSA|nr:DUF2868 domain-containing protein [Rhodothalassium salexigens]MBB4212459.1 hypothetical protein [Rhodothalassium salexigens DSM 2132]TCP31499.1 uncharacterized protein DUF2868 [Rhodothalassium salexigens DSM 2132]
MTLTRDRLVAETLAADRDVADPAAGAGREALAAARRHQDVDAKVCAFFAALPQALAARAALRRQIALLRWTVLGGLVLAALAGALAAGRAISGGEREVVNVIWLLGGLLGLHLVALVIWLAVLVAGGDGVARQGLGRGVVWLWRRLAGTVAGDPLNRSARLALMARLFGPPAGRWTVSTGSHGLWTAFLAGGLVSVLLVLATQHLVFVWETTILSAEHYTALIGALAAGPAALGFPVPDAAAVAAAEWRGGAQAARMVADAQGEGAWAGLVVGSLIVYGLAPRLLVGLLTGWLARRAVRRTKLDLTKPAFARLIPDLAPVMQSARVVDASPARLPPAVAASVPAPAPAPPHTPATGSDRRRGLRRAKANAPVAVTGGLPGGHHVAPPAGPVAVLGWEVRTPRTGWPPVVTPGQPPAGGAQDLGIVDGRRALTAAVALIANAPPARLVVVADMTATPDRGTVAGLATLAGAGAGETLVCLTRESVARARLSDEDARQRLADWVAAAHDAGLPLSAVVLLDLDAPGAEDADRAARLFGV